MATAQDLTEAMNDAMEARNVERAARAGYDGGSWGYHGNSLIEARYKAEQRVSEQLATALPALRGAAASLQAFVRMALGSVLGLLVGQAFDGSALPLTVSMLLFGSAALALVLYSEHGRLFRRLNPPGAARLVAGPELH